MAMKTSVQNERRGSHSRTLIRVALTLFLSVAFVRPAHTAGASLELGWNDEDMIAFFSAHEKKFGELASSVLSNKQIERVGRYTADVFPRSLLKDDPQNVVKLRQRMRDLQLDGAFTRESATNALFFAAKSTGTLVHGAEKGFCFLSKPPANLVADLDLAKAVKKNVVYYRLIGGRWYLYMIED